MENAFDPFNGGCRPKLTLRHRLWTVFARSDEMGLLVANIVNRWFLDRYFWSLRWWHRNHATKFDVAKSTELTDSMMLCSNADAPKSTKFSENIVWIENIAPENCQTDSSNLS